MKGGSEGHRFQPALPGVAAAAPAEGVVERLVVVLVESCEDAGAAGAADRRTHKLGSTHNQLITEAKLSKL